jgi:diketogulonate reductase-like aldo/keto reductase
MQFSPAIRKLVRRNAGSAIRTGQFDVPSAAASLEDSLRKLQTDCIDIFLLHECELSNCTDELLRFLEDARSAGKIKTFGIGTSFDQVEAIVIHKPEFCPVVQFKSNIVSQNIHLLRGKKNASEYPSNFITHGSFEPVKEILRRAKVDLAWTARWSKEIQADIADADVVVGLTLQQALHANEGGKILFQSSSLSRVAKNIHLAEIPKFCGEQLRAFERLGADLLPLHAD